MTPLIESIAPVEEQARTEPADDPENGIASGDREPHEGDDAGDPKPDGVIEIRNLYQPIEPERKEQLTQRLAAKCQQLAEVRQTKKERNRAYNDVLKSIEEEIARLADTISEMKELLPVRCQWFYDYGSEVKELTRLDTMEIVETRRLAREDHERPLPFEEQDDDE